MRKSLLHKVFFSPGGLERVQQVFGGGGVINIYAGKAAIQHYTCKNMCGLADNRGVVGRQRKKPYLFHFDIIKHFSDGKVGCFLESF